MHYPGAFLNVYVIMYFNNNSSVVASAITESRQVKYIINVLAINPDQIIMKCFTYLFSINSAVTRTLYVHYLFLALYYNPLYVSIFGTCLKS